MASIDETGTATNPFAGLNPTERPIDPDKTAHGRRITSGSGVRGFYGTNPNVTPLDAFNAAVDGYLYAHDQLSSISKGFPEIRELRFVCGRDPRPTGASLRQALLKGFQIALQAINAERSTSTALTLTVLDVGISTTPIIQNAVRVFDAHGGVIITASHNPITWNGFKFLTANREPGDPYSQRGSLLSFPRMAIFKQARAEFLRRLGQRQADAVRVSEQILAPVAVSQSFQYKQDGIGEQAVTGYFHYLRQMAGLADDRALDEFIHQARATNVPIIVDHNGGGAKGCNADLLRRFGLQVHEMGADLGIPSHEIDPMEAALDPAKEKLRQQGAGFAVVHDFDADRGTLVILGDDGPADLSPQYTCALNVYAMIHQYAPVVRAPGYANRPISVVVNCNTSGSIRVMANEFKQQEKVTVDVVEVETGEVNVVERMEEIRRLGPGIPVIGVEGSCGGVIFGGEQECATSRDGALTALMAAKLAITSGRSLNDIIKELPVFHTCFKSIAGITATPVQIKQALQREFDKRVTKKGDGWFTLAGLSDKRYRGCEVIHYIGTGAFDNMDKDTNGGYKIRLTDTEGNESFLWYRDSKTEPELYIESDSTDAGESQKFFDFMLGVLEDVNGGAKS